MCANVFLYFLTAMETIIGSLVFNFDAFLPNKYNCIDNYGKKLKKLKIENVHKQLETSQIVEIY